MASYFVMGKPYKYLPFYRHDETETVFYVDLPKLPSVENTPKRQK